MNKRQGRYSPYLRPLTYIIDVGFILVFALIFKFQAIDFLNFTLFVSVGWLLLSVNTGFYEVYRFTKGFRILSKSLVQIGLFSLIVFSFFGFFEDLSRPRTIIFEYLACLYLSIISVKLLVFYLLKRYRKFLGGNYRTTVILGENKHTQALKKFFTSNPSYGYHCKGLLAIQEKDSSFEKCLKFIIDNKIDEIYCSVTSLSNQQINELIDFADNNLKQLKFLPDNKDVYTRQLKMDYYGYLPILSLRDIPLQEPFNQLLKRIFDIVFSLFVIVFLLSWLTPILAIFIKLGSKGPVFFRQKRNGLNYKEFNCYKFRSMRENPQADLHQVKRGDKRITKIGKFLRKTSMDELPQFYNVLLGDMSVVGPRPHMVSHTHMYAERIDKFMVRHFIKPGITGLAQTSGFRGEVETENDIINRVRYDIFYLENWSLLLDLKIIFQTVYNAIRGEDKAY
ncbi:undecaprenyl-phosphate glucose phosphotransferase [Mesonia sp. HuA40]|uniref:undecaprenyl-phosphate glucose phosphotransferase n=1 Tax=Mesonia sp. HuA40 TaxID=2602761 RepID=UPI0011C9AFAF|nr:undecaprenyl-phosphate glucose phosphotransferase [Mesonia sp. HuA40]TXK72550.1 undecaprenyl-phosphate glucose phosphotransferase [Mesonia sp. HuA40]